MCIDVRLLLDQKGKRDVGVKGIGGEKVLKHAVRHGKAGASYDAFTFPMQHLPMHFGNLKSHFAINMCIFNLLHLPLRQLSHII